MTIECTAERMELDSCNVTRVGGSGTPPQPLQLIFDGCPTMPQVVFFLCAFALFELSIDKVLGPVRRGENGLQSRLTAFRIDGSAEIQIVCLVRFCARQCQIVSI